jgi:hypothetical protein
LLQPEIANESPNSTKISKDIQRFICILPS